MSRPQHVSLYKRLSSSTALLLLTTGLSACAGQEPAPVQYYGAEYKGKVFVDGQLDEGASNDYASNDGGSSGFSGEGRRGAAISETTYEAAASSGMVTSAPLDAAPVEMVSMPSPVMSSDIAPVSVDKPAVAKRYESAPSGVSLGLDENGELPRPAGPNLSEATPKASEEHSAVTSEIPSEEVASAGVSAAAQALTHRFESGDTLYSLSRRYKTSVQELMQANSIADAGAVAAGTELIIPGDAAVGSAEIAAAAPVAKPAVTLTKAEKVEEKPVQEVAVAKVDVAKVEVAKQQAKKVQKTEDVASTSDEVVQKVPSSSVSAMALAEDTGAKEVIPVPAAYKPIPDNAKMEHKSGRAFIWPVEGEVVSKFGNAGGLHNDGINIRTEDGAPVMATADGVVAYAGSGIAPGYGNLVILQHPRSYFSAYAYTRDMVVKKGDNVRQGQTIAHVGTTGSLKEPQLHFSVRQEKKPVNPLTLLGPLEKGLQMAAVPAEEVSQ